jgi:uncharacterized membrane protein
MAFPRSLRHRSLRASEVLPFYDSVFAAAFTLLAFNLPDRLAAAMVSLPLLSALGWYGLMAVSVSLYWYKLRRLVVLDRFLQPPQLLLLALGLLIVVLLPKLASLVLRHGVGAGTLLEWTLPQVVNTTCLGLLVLFNILCYLYAWSLQRRRGHRGRSGRLLEGMMLTQLLGLAAMVVLIVLELSFTWFDNQYIYLLPLVLIAEEITVARLITRYWRQQEQP